MHFGPTPFTLYSIGYLAMARPMGLGPIKSRSQPEQPQLGRRKARNELWLVKPSTSKKTIDLMIQSLYVSLDVNR